MITYYDDRSVRVTSAEIRVDGQGYRLADCTHIWHRRGRRRWRVLARRYALGIGLAVPLVGAVLGVLTVRRLHSSSSVTVAIVGASVLAVLTIGPLADVLLEHLDRSYARGSRRWEIWAHCQGQPVRLLHTDDALRFGQIYRALQRAMEQQLP